MRISARILLAAFAALLSAFMMFTACAIKMWPMINLFRFEQRGPDRLYFLALPGYVALVVFALMLVVLPRRRIRVPGRCSRCGYDLTGNVSGVCPECGARVRKP